MLPPNQPFVHRVFHDSYHPFWGVDTPTENRGPEPLEVRVRMWAELWPGWLTSSKT